MTSLIRDAKEDSTARYNGTRKISYFDLQHLYANPRRPSSPQTLSPPLPILRQIKTSPTHDRIQELLPHNLLSRIPGQLHQINTSTSTR